jgi:hypothetical protein
MGAGASNASAGESGTSRGWIDREGCRSPSWCKYSSLSKNLALLSSTGTALNLSKVALCLESLERGGNAAKVKGKS